MASLLEMAQRTAAAALPIEHIPFGPWDGSMRSKTADEVPREYVSGGSNFLYLPRERSFKRRGGQAQKFDTFGAAVGLLPAKWGSKGRWLDQFTSESIVGGVPTLMGLATRETVTTGLDDGRFSQVYVRDQVNSINYTLGDDFSASTYPAIGSAQKFKFVPLWYDSGDGGLTRGASEFSRRFLVSGSRRFLKVGNWTYFPSLLGTPSRWRGRFTAGSAVSVGVVSSTISGAESVNNQWAGNNVGEGGTGSTPDLSSEIDETPVDDGTSWIRSNGSPPASQARCHFGLNTTIDSTVASWTISYRALRDASGAGNSNFVFTLYRSDGLGEDSASTSTAALTTSWADYTIEINFVGGGAADTANSIAINCTASNTNRVQISRIQVYPTASPAGPGNEEVNRLFPTGPIPPLHSGTLAKGSTISDDEALPIRPDADVTDGDWTDSSAGTDLFSHIDEASLDTNDYITSPINGAPATIRLEDPAGSYVPTLIDTVTMRITWRALGSLASTGSVSMRLMEGATERAIFQAFYFLFNSGAAWKTHSYTLTPAEKASITDWTNLNIQLNAFQTGGTVSEIRVAQAYVSIGQAVIQSQGGWKGSDRYYYGVAFRNEDGSVWAPCQARVPSQILTNGYNIFTVDVANPSATYDKVAWSNIPIGPHGTTGRLLLRSPKISAVEDDNLQLDPFDMRVIWEIQDNTTTTYDDYYGTDESLTLDVFKAFIRNDHIMAPRARYIFGGDMRVCHAYGGQSPAAIVIAPVGRAADYDLNVPDDNAAAYNSQGSWMQINLDTAGAGRLVLIQGDAATATDTKTILFTAATTLQQLVDTINGTNVSDDGQQWRAQLCPGANPDATTLSLVPHNRAIASCVVDNTAKTITKAAGGLSKVAVGHLISGAAAETGAYVTVINSDTMLTYSGSLTATTETLYFYNDLGDSHITDPNTSALGFQRVICGASPGFLYFTKSYLDGQTLDKQAVWMTVASPGQAKSAANNFSGKGSNRFAPPEGGAGISMGGASVDQGFVVPYADRIYAIKNIHNQGSGLDEDYRITLISASHGCCAWATVVPGNRFVPYLTPQGMFAADLEREAFLSPAIHMQSPARGDFTYEIPLCEAAAGADTDGAYASSRIMRSALWVSYRASGSHPNRQVAYDFSGATELDGLGALMREPGIPWGWSVPLVRSITAMAEGVLADGSHLYGWNDENGGSVGDGRIDEIETGDTDNGTDISGSVEGPWEKGRGIGQISGQEIILWHDAPTGSTGFLDFTRSYQADLYSMTPSTSSSLVVSRDPKMLTLPARVGSAACHVGYRQLTGGARTVRQMVLKAKFIPTYK